MYSRKLNIGIMRTIAFSLCLFALSVTQVHAQWVESASCDELSSRLANKAITHLLNLEPLSAVATAEAALIVDNSCALGHLILADAAIERDKQLHLDKLSKAGLSSVESSYLKIILSSDEERPAVAEDVFKKSSDNALLHFKYASSNQDWDSMLDGAKQHVGSEVSLPFLNTVAYGYSGGQYGEPNYDRAMELLDIAITIQESPNIRDSRAEHFANMGDFESAFEEQLHAYASNGNAGSPYRTNLVKYYRATQHEQLQSELKTLVQKRMDATRENDREVLQELTVEGYSAVACNSNLEACYVTDPSVEPNINLEWLSFEANNMEVYFNGNFDNAIITFDANGSYTTTGEVVTNYSTRVSEVWSLEEGAWKMWLSNYAPKPDASGIPSSLSSIYY